MKMQISFLRGMVHYGLRRSARNWSAFNEIVYRIIINDMIELV